jgi:hypothetical protein
MKDRVVYQGFQETRNRRLAGGVEPLGTAALLTPTDGAEDGLVPTVAASLAAFFAASYEAFFVTASSAVFFAPPLRWLSSSPLPLWWPTSSPPLWRPPFFPTASSVAFFAAATTVASFAIVALVTTAVSPAANLLLDPPGAVARATADEACLDAGAAGGGLPAIDLPRPCALIRLCSGTSSSDDTSSSLRMTHTTFPFPLLGVKSGESAILATRGACPRDLYASGLATPLDRCNTNIVHRRHRHQ